MEELKATIAESFKENVGEKLTALEQEIAGLKANKVSDKEARAQKSAEFIKQLVGGEVKTITTNTNSFGYTIPTELASAIHEKRDAIAKMRKYAFVFTQAGNFQVPVQGTGVTSYWVTTEADTDLTASNPTVTQATLSDNWLATRVVIPKSLLNASAVDIENYVTNLSSRSIVLAEETSFVGGDGDGQATGFRAATVGSVAQASTSLAYADLVNLYFSLPEQYRANAVFMVSTAALKLIKGLKDTVGMPMFNVNDGTLFGKPVLEMGDIPSNLGSAENESEIWFGDLKEYWIKDGADMGMLANNVPARLQVELFVYEAVDGIIVNADAFKKLTGVK